jgi:hypothetical protein
MNTKVFVGIAMAVCIFNTVALGQTPTTIQLSGKVNAVDNSTITLQSGTDNWTINRTATTSVTSGNLTIGATITVKCLPTDAHKNERTSLGGSATPPP